MEGEQVLDLGFFQAYFRGFLSERIDFHACLQFWVNCHENYVNILHSQHLRSNCWLILENSSEIFDQLWHCLYLHIEQDNFCIFHKWILHNFELDWFLYQLADQMRKLFIFLIELLLIRLLIDILGHLSHFDVKFLRMNESQQLNFTYLLKV